MKQVGQTIESRGEFDELPAGTQVMNPTGGDIWTKGDGGEWRENGSGRTSTTLRTDNYLVVYSVPHLGVGETPRSYADYYALPVGTVCGGTGADDRWVKQDDHLWHHLVHNRVSQINEGRSLNVGGAVRVISLPDAARPAVAVGTLITRPDQYQNLPVGSVVESVSGRRWEKQADTYFHRVDTGVLCTNRTYLVRPSTVISLPGDTTCPAVGDMITSVDQYRALPVGSLVRGDNEWRKTDEVDPVRGNVWRRVDDPTQIMHDNRLSVRGTIRVVSTAVSTVERLPVGTALTTQAHFDACPVGTIINSGARRYRKREPLPANGNTGWWSMRGEEDVARQASFNVEGGINRIESYPEEVVVNESGLNVGDLVTSREQFELLPIGTVVGPRNATEQYRSEEGGWRNVNGGTLWPTNGNGGLSLNYNVVVSLPLSVSPTYESANQYKWKFRQHVISAAMEHFGDSTSAVAVLERLGVTPEAFPVGTDVIIASDIDARALPNGSVVYHGNPRIPDRFGVFVKRAGRWTHLFGGRLDFSYPVTVDTVEGRVVEVDWNKPAAEPDDDAINSFKGQAWREGWVEKMNRSWCGTYEAVMERIGINQTHERFALVTESGLRCGGTVTPGQVAALPVGSVVKWVNSDDPDRWCYAMRTERITNAAGTRVVVRHNSGRGHYASSMTLEWTPEFGNMRMAMPNVTDLFDVLPIGTVWNQNGASYVLCQDRLGAEGMEVRETGRYGYAQFSHPIMVTSFPVPS